MVAFHARGTCPREPFDGDSARVSTRLSHHSRGRLEQVSLARSRGCKSDGRLNGLVGQFGCGKGAEFCYFELNVYVAIVANTDVPMDDRQAARGFEASDTGSRGHGPI